MDFNFGSAEEIEESNLRKIYRLEKQLEAKDKEIERLRAELEDAKTTILRLRDTISESDDIAMLLVLTRDNKQLRDGLRIALGQCRYWLKTYRSHTGFMNATHLMEKESLEKAISTLEELLGEGRE